jgi:hypothetical protein
MEGDQWIEEQMEEAQSKPIHVRILTTPARVCVYAEFTYVF